MLTQRPYFLGYTCYLSIITLVSCVYFYQHTVQHPTETHPAIYAYFVIKGFLIFANSTLPFKNFHFNPIIFRALFNLGIGLLLAFLYLQLYQDTFLILIDCGLSLITVFSLMKMHHNKHVQQNHL